MPAHSQQHLSPYSPTQLFDLVADVERYPEFIPWVGAARVLRREQNHMLAELKIRFSGISTSYTSDITLHAPVGDKPGTIDVRLVSGPFRHLSNGWEFCPAENGGSMVHFEIDFAFQSSMFEKVIGGLFEKAVMKMITAFDQRAKQLYG